MRPPLPASFSETVSKIFGKDKVLVATLSRPSQPIKKWYKKWTPPEGIKAVEGEVYGELYDQLIKDVERTIKNEKLASVTYIWMQGEADAEAGWGAVYEKSFLGVLEQLKADLGIPEIHFVLGRINDYWLPETGIKDGEIVRKIQMKLGEEHANGGWVNTDDLNTGINPWGLYEINSGHFPPAGYRVLGQRFARKASMLIDPTLKLDETFFDAVFFDSGHDIKSHAAIAKIVSGTAPDAAHSSGALGLATLVDGKFGSSDHQDIAWIGFAPTQKSIEFVVDLGAVQDISCLGLNLLVNQKAAALFPEKVTLLTSTDGTQYSPAHNKGISFFYKRDQKNKWLTELKSKPILLLVDTSKTSGRYIKIQVELEKSSWLFVDEIVVNPVAK